MNLARSPRWWLEACYGWYWAADTLAAAGAEVHPAHPLGVKGFSHRRVKNDELDARDLAGLLRMGRLPEAWIAPGRDPRAPRDHQVPAEAGPAAHQLQGPGPRGAGQARHRGDRLRYLRCLGTPGPPGDPQPVPDNFAGVASKEKLLTWKV